MAGIQINSIFLSKRGQIIDEALQEIGCQIEINVPGKPALINHSNFHPRRDVVTTAIQDVIKNNPSPRTKVLQAYYKECAEHNIPAFATGGRCFSCGYDLVDVKNNRMKGTTGCPRCHRSFCD